MFINEKGRHYINPFPFTDFTGAKNRPALILVETVEDITVSFTSLVRLSKLVTISKELVLGRLGQLNELELNEINGGLVELLDLKNIK
ncbi:hypothetical protein [Autumnicola musiva]|uniref:Type II toxin-antitoxin system PemK/MazF family toxin n=1 Tax=Autumnicola musiva TaxID=3075589 RepID=A0ABU3D252_9FLAO|nr:hypothetical protein [Zunongwangia sp. F117]MDT0675613.1 hypothetical protein [Zunongwangia sp. F117]